MDFLSPDFGMFKSKLETGDPAGFNSTPPRFSFASSFGDSLYPKFGTNLGDRVGKVGVNVGVEAVASEAAVDTNFDKSAS